MVVLSPRASWSVLCAGLLLLVLGGCGTADRAGPPVTPGDGSLPAGSWVLTGGEDADGAVTPLDAHPVTLEVGEDAVSGTAACNGYSGRIASGADGRLLGALTVTEMGCSPAAVMALEQRYLGALARATEAAGRGPGLVLTGPTVRLEFRAADSDPDPS